MGPPPYPLLSMPPKPRGGGHSRHQPDADPEVQAFFQQPVYDGFLKGNDRGGPG